MYIFTWLITEVPNNSIKKFCSPVSAVTTGYAHEKIALTPTTCLTQKINSIWIIYINIKARAVKLIEGEGHRMYLWSWSRHGIFRQDAEMSKYTLNDKLNLMRSKNFHSSKCTNANKYASQRENVYYVCVCVCVCVCVYTHKIYPDDKRLMNNSV